MRSFKNYLFIFSLIICVNQCLSDYKYQKVTVTCEELENVNDHPPVIYYNHVNMGNTNTIRAVCENDRNSTAFKLLRIKGKIPVLGENSITNLTRKFYKFNISDVGLKELNPGVFKNLQNIYTLDLHNNKVKVIKKGVFDNISIKNILLGNNEISDIEANAFGFVNSDWESVHWYAVALNLSNNKLETIDPEAFNNEYINALYLVNNRIKKISPGDLKNIPRLAHLHVSRNFIKEIPNGVFNGSSIHTLNFDYNEISVIGNEAFNDMTFFNRFSIRHNKLKQWNGHWFRRSMDGIILSLSLHISYNEIEEIPEYAFQYMEFYHDEWNVIEFDGNFIKNISDNAFSGLRKMYILNLNHNHLEHWNKDWLKGMKLDQIDLTFNKLCQEKNASSIVPQAKNVFVENCKN